MRLDNEEVWIAFVVMLIAAYVIDGVCDACRNIKDIEERARHDARRRKQ